MAWVRRAENLPQEVRLSRRRLVILLAAIALVGTPPAAKTDEPPLIAAASDLQFALPEIAAKFEKETGLAVRLAFGSSGNLARQIRQRAPFQIYMSADEGYVLGLARDGLARDEGAPYALGRIVIIVPHGSTLEPDSELEGLRAALKQAQVQKFAIPNPEHAPYGARAKEALRHAGLWTTIEQKLVIGENVSQAAQFALSGATQGGIVAYSLALAPKLAERSRFALIPQQWHQPLRQRMTLLKGAGAIAERFYGFLQEPQAREILRQYGFLLPGEQS